jgi:3-deoxy-D-manno-octulosonate 8-phosphate phosphatase KdsC-like HAD superfamily phosphatase
MKRFSDHDWTAIKELQRHNIDVCLISGDKWNSGVALRRKVDFIYSRNKLDELPEICNRYQLHPDEIAMIGDDTYDAPVMEAVGYAYLPIGASPLLEAILKNSEVEYEYIDTPAGNGVIARFVHDTFLWARDGD